MDWAAFSPTRDLPAAKVGDEGLQAEVVDRAGEAARCGVEEGDSVVGEELVAAAAEAEVVLDVARGPGERHARPAARPAGHGAAQGGPLRGYVCLGAATAAALIIGLRWG
ncbi:hypothetical protein [Streptomyces chattanoogensis]|uniref:Uncharacterized protein n=1 Tax=Streptomyces chattanoogensis TaxID=66876 RepID=A0A0N0GYR1_9ACTN|nr:hypothetical protein [Streptomyces chattanoogensis]KPC61800.1 hypothetical protein ADL29_22195 [Streptomyces chattanoogensis]